MGDSVPIAKIRHLRQLNSQRSTDSSKDSSDIPNIPLMYLKKIRENSERFKGYAAPKLNIKNFARKPEIVQVHPIFAFLLDRGLVEKLGRFCICSVSLKDFPENPQLTTRRKLILEKYYKSFKSLYVLLAVTEEGEEYYFSFPMKEIQSADTENIDQYICSECGRL